MPTVRDLDRLWRTLLNALRILHRTIPGDDLNRCMLGQLCGDRVRFTVWQQINHTTTFKVNNDRAITLPFAFSPVINTDDAWCR